MKRTPWFPGSKVPLRAGWYERDHRSCVEYVDPADRRICRDWWEPVRDNRSILYPGVWYIKDEHGLNDASRQDLPWRGLAKDPGTLVDPDGQTRVGGRSTRA